MVWRHNGTNLSATNTCHALEIKPHIKNDDMHAVINQNYKNRIRKSLVFISYERSNKISEYSFIAQSIELTIRPLCLSLLIKKVNQRLPVVKLFDTQGEEGATLVICQ